MLAWEAEVTWAEQRSIPVARDIEGMCREGTAMETIRVMMLEQKA